IAADAGREDHVGAIDDEALGVRDLAGRVAVEGARFLPQLLRLGAALAHRALAQRTGAVAPLAGEVHRAVLGDLAVDRDRRERRRDARRMAHADRLDAGLGEPDADVVDRGVRRRRAQYALAARDSLANDLDERARLAGAGWAPDQRDVAGAQRPIHGLALLRIELRIERLPRDRRERVRFLGERGDVSDAREVAGRECGLRAGNRVIAAIERDLRRLGIQRVVAVELVDRAIEHQPD